MRRVRLAQRLLHILVILGLLGSDLGVSPPPIARASTPDTISFARTGLPQPVSSATYDKANELTQWGSATLTYDANGNLTNDGTNTYTWNARNQLASISGPSTVASFSYDAVGHRTSKTINGTTTGFLYDGSNPVQELAGTTPSANLLTGLATDETLTRTDSTGTSTLLPDALGSTTALTDSSGTIQTQYTYDPFGNATPSGAANANSYQFTGRENDGTGLDYYRARYYSPTLQRFISEDPLGFGGGDPNLYAYAGNDPIDLTDPSGECPICAAVVAGALIGAGVGGVSAWLSGGNVLRGAGEGALAGGVGVLAGAAVLAVAGPVGVGATAAAIASAFTAGAVGDTAVQGADIVLGARKSFDPGEAVLSGAIGAVTGGWYESGWEIKINSNLRIAPFGNRTDNPTGELPHYHRRGLDPSNPGATSPGQGIGRHRPWDTRTPDTSFWNRF